MKHKDYIVKVKDLMYKGCEPHWGCKRCGAIVPFHCYKREEFAELECREEDVQIWKKKENRTW